MTNLFTNYSKSLTKTIEAEKSLEVKVLGISESGIRKYSISKDFQRYVPVMQMMKEGIANKDIVARLMAEMGTYAGTDKATSEKTTKGFVSKISSIYNAITGKGKHGICYYELQNMMKGHPVSKSCTFKSYATLGLKAYTG
jgi:hypothetical protein